MPVATQRALSVPPFHAMVMNQRASVRESQGVPVLHLHVGQPATGAPRAAIDAVRDRLEVPLGYTNAVGLAELRERIAADYLERHGLRIDLERILVVGGASAGFTLAFLAMFEPGQRVGVIEPGYPCYRNGLLACGVEPVPIAVGPDTHWEPTPTLLEQAAPLDGLIVASPSNPTGRVIPATDLAALVSWCETHNVTLIADEIYHGITYRDAAPTVLSATDDALVINSFSKYFSMTGWRIGWMVLPEHLIEPVTRLQENLYICAPHISQIAAVAAMGATEELDGHVERYRINRAALLDGLAALGIDRVADADGAFYVYADISHLLSSDAGSSTDPRPRDSMELCLRWLDEIDLAVTPGIDFDLERGDHFIRFSYSGHLDTIEQACNRLQGWLERS